MGYRELLKKYIRFVEAHTGDHFIDSIGYGAEPLLLSNRELGELRAVLSELSRETDGELGRYERTANFNFRLRLLSTCYGLTLHEIAALSGADTQTVRRWRTNPRSRHFVEMCEQDFERFESSLLERVILRNRTIGLHRV